MSLGAFWTRSDVDVTSSSVLLVCCRLVYDFCHSRKSDLACFFDGACGFQPPTIGFPVEIWHLENNQLTAKTTPRGDLRIELDCLVMFRSRQDLWNEWERWYSCTMDNFTNRNYFTQRLHGPSMNLAISITLLLSLPEFGREEHLGFRSILRPEPSKEIMSLGSLLMVISSNGFLFQNISINHLGRGPSCSLQPRSYYLLVNGSIVLCHRHMAAWEDWSRPHHTTSHG